MATSDSLSLRTAIKRIDEMGQLVRIKKPVEPTIGIASICNTIMKQRANPPTLLFENVEGYPGRAICSLMFASRTRSSAIIGFPEDELQAKLKHLDALNSPLEPELVSSGPCQENVVTKNIDVLDLIPSIKGAQSVSHQYYQPIVITKHPRTGVRNAAMYRSCIQGPDTVTVNLRHDRHAGLHLQAAKEMGQPLPVALVLGASPAEYLAAVTKVPYSYFELGYAGAMQGRPVEMVKCKTIDLEVPASAEIIIEGEVRPPYRLGDDGPWPEYLKYLGMNIHPPIMDVTAVTYRNNPISYATIPALGDDIGRAGGEAQLYKTLKEFAGEFVVDACFTLGSINHHAVVKVRKTHPLHEGLQINVALTAFSYAPFVDTVTVVDDDVDIYDYQSLDWAICSRCNPARQIHILPEGRTHQNVPIAGVREMDQEPVVKGKMIVDATIPWGYRIKEKSPGITYFSLSEWADVDLSKYLEPEDL